MEFDNEIFQIFSALDSENQGFIDKNDFVEKILQFVSQSGELENETIMRIEQLMTPFEKIGLKEFGKIYASIQGIERMDEIVSLDSENINASSSRSSGSSDIDEVTDQVYSQINFRSDWRPSKSSQSSSSDSMLMSPNSASRHARELLHNSKESLEKLVNRSMSLDNGAGGRANLNSDGLTYDSTELQKEIDSLHRDNSAMQNKIEDLINRLKDVQSRFQDEKDQNKIANERIFLLEDSVHDLEIRNKQEIKKINEEWRSKLVAMEQSVDQIGEEFKMRYGDIEKRLLVACNETDDLQSLCKKLSHDNDVLRRETLTLRSQAQDNELMLLDYKKVASRQVTELQTERDHLEMVNMQLYNEIQTIKHLPPPNQNPQQALEKSQSDTLARSRSLSEYMSPYRSIRNKRTSEINQRKVSQVNVPKSGSIEADTNRVVHSLTMENRNLVERIAHLETVVYYQREKLDSSNYLSVAAEMEQLNLDELKKALTVEREAVKSLQKYIESLVHRLLVAGHIDVFQQLP